MIVTVASGKGGTGKTMVATSLALSIAMQGETQPHFLDCDVEAPNAHLFLAPQINETREASLLIPVVDESKCTHCGKCAEVCQYHAITVLGKKTLVFPQLCHGCGNCTALCPEEAIHEEPERLGVIERGQTTTNIAFAHGVLDVGKPMAVPVIRQLKKWQKPAVGQIVICDAPPGTSCPVVESIRDSDFLLLVSEPTPFGLHDLQLAVQVSRTLGIPAGVIINRENGGYSPLNEFCESQGLPILMQIPYERAIAQGIAQGKTLLDIHPKYEKNFWNLYQQVDEKIK